MREWSFDGRQNWAHGQEPCLEVHGHSNIKCHPLISSMQLLKSWFFIYSCHYPSIFSVIAKSHPKMASLPTVFYACAPFIFRLGCTSTLGARETHTKIFRMVKRGVTRRALLRRGRRNPFNPKEISLPRNFPVTKLFSRLTQFSFVRKFFVEAVWCQNVLKN